MLILVTAFGANPAMRISQPGSLKRRHHLLELLRPDRQRIEARLLPSFPRRGRGRFLPELLLELLDRAIAGSVEDALEGRDERL